VAGVVSVINVRYCVVCGVEYLARRPSSRYCSDRCRQRAKRGGTARPGAAKLPPPVDTPLLAAVRRELEAAGRADSWLGRAALMLAWRLGDPACPSAAIAPLPKELRFTMAVALKDVIVGADPLDEIQRRRELKRRSRVSETSGQGS
jgi:hypothetical protein